MVGIIYFLVFLDFFLIWLDPSTLFIWIIYFLLTFITVNKYPVFIILFFIYFFTSWNLSIKLIITLCLLAHSLLQLTEKVNKLDSCAKKDVSLLEPLPPVLVTEPAR